ncbi:non-ribosomal peptide synthetase [Paenibacillus alvei]|uniref:Amino acid adenylation domain-containing protein n=1 Tax=Paenibacillus alvei TaxID=44250 RepID=A0AAP7A527_PAEAL|nr:non-ribosomal peptide synthetase [Paenibacillus alvei]NOJ74037.1 amino acid adenylation domain-containing protein [Paenibacillus alvei]
MAFRRDHVQDMYPLSPLQKGMLFHSLEGALSDAYFVQVVTYVEGLLDPELMLQAFRKLVKRHDVFRTAFLHEGLKEPIQVVLSECPVEARVVSADCGEGSDTKELVDSYVKEDRERGFDITKDSLVRAAVLQLGEEEWEIVLSFHHILMDGWCSDLVFHEWFQIYESLKRGAAIELPVYPPYSQYIKWLAAQDQEAAITYWKTQMAGYEPRALLPAISRKNTENSYEPSEHRFSFDRETTERLVQMARTNGLAVSALLHVFWGLLLQKYNDQRDAVFGSVTFGRPAAIPQADKMIGLFIHTVPVRIQSKPNQPFMKLAEQVHRQILASQEYAYCGLSDIQARCSDGLPLFDHIFAFEHQSAEPPWHRIAAGNGLHIRKQRVYEHTNYSLSVTAALRKDEELNLTFIYNANVVSDTLLRQMSRYFQNVVQCVLQDERANVASISLLSPKEETARIQGDAAGRQAPHEEGMTIADLFERQVMMVPGHTALILDDQAVTYEELNQRANVVGHFLQNKGIRPDNLVGIVAEKSFEMVIGIVGILKSGAAYVPMAPDNPADRLAVILEDSQPSILLVQRCAYSKLEAVLRQIGIEEKPELIVIEEVLSDTRPEQMPNPNRDSTPHHLGYVIYTSGSTGKPKGILTQQNSIIRVVKKTNYIEITPHDTLLQLSNYAFDGSAFDLFGALLNGARLVLVKKEDALEMQRLLQIIEEKGVTVFFATTALFNALVDANLQSLAKIRKVLFGGERVSFSHVKKAFGFLGKGKILHMYGPTESTVFATCHEVNQLDETLGTVPIGIPLANTGVLILNQDNQLQPTGAVGELCISGAGLARGYLHNEDLTGSCFVKHPYRLEERLYKTGDLARWLEDGTIEYIGRADQQVKIRGFRIELGEIEYRLLLHEGIREAVAAIIQASDGAKALCAYYAAEEAIPEAELRESLLQALPDYMVPALFIWMESLPLNANGKIEMNRLPALDMERAPEEHYVAPGDEMESKLAEIWQEVLGVKQIGITDNYFRLGGDSIKAIQLCARLRDCRLSLSVSDLLKHPTIQTVKGCVVQVPLSEANTDAAEAGSLDLTNDELADLEKELRLAIGEG